MAGHQIKTATDIARFTQTGEVGILQAPRCIALASQSPTLLAAEPYELKQGELLKARIARKIKSLFELKTMEQMLAQTALACSDLQSRFRYLVLR